MGSQGPGSQLILPEAAEGVTSRHCAECRTPFAPYSRAQGYQKYCSHACRQRVWRREAEKREGRRATKAERILARLQEGPANTLDLARVGGVRFSARILELRQEGYRIKTEPREEYAIYTLEGEER